MSGFEGAEKRRQEVFRNTSPTVSAGGRSPHDARGRRYSYLLALGYEEENLYPGLRGRDGALQFFANRGLSWWQAARASGDTSGGSRPTRNMASSQIACVNFLLPLVDIPGALAAVLRAIDDDVTDAEDIPDERDGALMSPVEFEWFGQGQSLEGSRTRGAFSTSVNAFMVASTPRGRRAYLLDWRYVDDPTGGDLGRGRPGETRRRRYSGRYAAESSSFNNLVPLDDLLFNPFYQIMRFRLLADRMVTNRELGVSEAKVVVVVPEENLAFRHKITSPQLAHRFPRARTVDDVVRAVLNRPDVAYSSVCPSALANAVREQCGDAASDWEQYHRARYGW